MDGEEDFLRPQLSIHGEVTAEALGTGMDLTMRRKEWPWEARRQAAGEDGSEKRHLVYPCYLYSGNY